MELRMQGNQRCLKCFLRNLVQIGTKIADITKSSSIIATQITEVSHQLVASTTPVNTVLVITIPSAPKEFNIPTSVPPFPHFPNLEQINVKLKKPAADAIHTNRLSATTKSA